MPILGSQGSTKGPSTAPTIGSATAGDANASVTFTAPSFSKLPITSYTVTASPGGATGTGASSPITVSGLSNGTAYTFTVTATHANGVSAASEASNSVTPISPKFAYFTLGDPSYQTTINKFNFSDETRTSFSAWSNNRDEAAAFSNGGTAGYISGSSSLTSSIEKISFPGDTVSTISATQSTARRELAGFSNSGTAGYWAGGEGSGGRTTTVDKLTYSGEARTTLGTGLSQNTGQNCGFSNSGTAGYSAGGQAGGGLFSTVDKFTYSTDSRSSGGILPAARVMGATFANSGTAGYYAGGLKQSSFDEVSTVYKYSFSGESWSTVSNSLSQGRTNTGGASHNGVAGYIAGGSTYPDGTQFSTVNKILYSNDSISTLGTGLSQSVDYTSGFANSGTL
jgi:large repetitive protein